MNAAKNLECLLDAGVISKPFYNSAMKLAARGVDNMNAIFAMVGNTPLKVVEIDTSTTPSPPLVEAVYAVITSDADIVFSVTETPSFNPGHTLKAGTNYKFSYNELVNLQFSGSANLTITYYV